MPSSRMSDYLNGLAAFAAKHGGKVEFTTSEYGTRMTRILGTATYETLPNLQDAYSLFGPTKIATLVKPNMDGTWEFCLVCIR